MTDLILAPELRVEEDSYVAIRGELASNLIHSDDFMYEAEYYLTDEEHKENYSAFLERFEVVTADNANPGYILDKESEYYTGLTCVRVIRDRESRNTFGLRYRQGVGKHDDEARPDDSNTITLGDQSDWYVFRPVKEFTITGYEFVK